MNDRKRASRKERIERNILELRNQLWPELQPKEIWNRKVSSGFTTVPRTLPLIHRIMDDLSSGAPLSGAYFALWARVHDQSFLVLDNPREAAFESGFSGERAESSWKSRMKKLVELEFIRAEEGPAGPYHYVLLLNPYFTVQKLLESGKVNMKLYRALMERTFAIGADDLNG